MKIYLTFLFLFATTLVVEGQYFQYSQHNFTDLRINPALVASSDYASVGLIFRNQSTAAPEVRLKSSMVSAVYPFLSRRSGVRWSGLGISLMDDRSGGIFSTQEASLSYAINIFLSRFQSLSLGFKGLYQRRSVDLTGLFTGSQYVRDRGFDFNISNGESMGSLGNDFATFSSGLYWQQQDRQARRIAHWGVSFFDINRPHDSFLGIDQKLHATWVFTGGIRMYQEKNISVYPEILLTRSPATTVVNMGAVTSYELKPYPNQIAGRVDLITKYVFGRSGILGLQFHRDNLAIGFSYDFPLLTKNPANTGAFEIGIQLKSLVDPDLKNRSARKSNAKRGAGQRTPVSARKPVARPVTKALGKASGGETRTIAKDSRADSSVDSQKPVSSMKHKTDSVIAHARAGQVSHEPFVIERLNLRFNFEFNSTSLDEPSLKYLDDLAEALKDNLITKVQLTGHTDNVGSAAFNMRLSVYRANVIREHLIRRGVESSRIKISGKGLTEPLNGNRTEEERALNRRVELMIYYQE